MTTALQLGSFKPGVGFVKVCTIAASLALAGFIFLVFFRRLGDDPIRQWDEASVAANSFEMLVRGEPFAKYFGGEPDFINTKPPLLNWLVASSMALFGPTPFALRLPSAVAATTTVLTVWLFTARALGNRVAAFAAAFVLCTSIGFIGEHVARGGDYDALLTLFVTMFALAAFHFAQTGRRRSLVVAAAAFALALITKGIAAVLPVPGIALYFLLTSERRRLLLRPSVIVAALLALLPIGIVYGLTELAQPGYLATVGNNELWGRFGSLAPGGTPSSGLYYLEALYEYRFWPWLLLLPFSFVLREPFVRFGALYLGTFLLVISSSETRYHWYDAPFYPVAAICVGLLIARAPRMAAKRPVWALAASATFAILFAYSAYQVGRVELRGGRPLFRENDRAIPANAERYRVFLDDILSDDRITRGERLALANPSRYNTPLLFVRDVAAQRWQQPLHLDWETPMERAPDAAWVASCGPELDAAISREGSFRRVTSGRGCSLWRRLESNPVG
jgi:4-amino-4-deoxy-L-arabinose transferase-like glycosyltransferase